MPRKKATKQNQELIQSLKGMNDIYFDNYYKYQGFFERAQEISHYFDFKPIETPILERSNIFETSVGIGTDIVEKEMYTFKTKGGEKVAMRPEGTAAVMRSYLEHGMQSLPQPVMLYYYGPFFRHDNPQKGRLREFRQFGLEIIGSEKSINEVLILKTVLNILNEVGCEPIIDINSIGCKECRPLYLKALVQYYKKQKKNICSTCRIRLKINPLRIFDCKNEKCTIYKEDAPDALNYLCDECKKHFKEVLEYLEELKIPYRMNKTLVRGLSYYNRTVFEIFDQRDQELAIGGGGRYDYLAKALKTKKEIPACGCALGVDRIVNSSWFINIPPRFMKKPKIYFAQIGSEAKLKSLNLIEKLRKAKIPIYHAIAKDSLSYQLSMAEKLKIPYVIIFGQKEAYSNTVIIRDMNTHSQEVVSQNKIIDYIKKLK